MTNIQDILNTIQKSDIAKLGRNGGLQNLSKRKKVYVFHLGELIDVVDGRRQCILKYGENVSTSFRRNRPINGYYFSYKNKYEPKETWVNLDRNKTIIVYKDGSTKEFATQKECGEFLNIGRAEISNIKAGRKKLPTKYSDIEKIIFVD